MSEQLALVGLRPSTSFAAASHAKTSASPARASGSQASAPASGESSRASSASCDRASLLSRTSLDSFGGAWTRLSPTSPLRVTRWRQRASEPRTSARLTAENDSSLWPTPSASEYGTSNNGDPHDGRGIYATAGKPSLSTLARQWHYLPAIHERRRRSGAGCSCLRDEVAARQWSTPQARDLKGEPSDSRGKRNLWLDIVGRPPPTTCGHGGPCRPTLNPRFVAWLMGFGPSWPTVALSWLPWEMPLFPKSPR
jgi:hypothetical protein